MTLMLTQIFIARLTKTKAPVQQLALPASLPPSLPRSSVIMLLKYWRTVEIVYFMVEDGGTNFFKKVHYQQTPREWFRQWTANKQLHLDSLILQHNIISSLIMAKLMEWLLLAADSSSICPNVVCLLLFVVVCLFIKLKNCLLTAC